MTSRTCDHCAKPVTDAVFAEICLPCRVDQGLAEVDENGDEVFYFAACERCGDVAGQPDDAGLCEGCSANNADRVVL